MRAQHRQHDEPHHHHRPEHLADLFGAAALQQEQPHQDDQGERHDPGLEGVGCAQAFHRRQHRDGRGQHAVAIEQRQAQQAPPRRWRSWPGARPGARCASAASAITPPSPLLSARMMKHDIFDGHHDHQRPEDQRQRAIDGGRAGGMAARGQRGFAHGIERAGADIAEHHAQGAQVSAQGAAERNVGRSCFNGRPSDGDLRAQLHHPVGRQVIEARGRQGVAPAMAR